MKARLVYNHIGWQAIVERVIAFHYRLKCLKPLTTLQIAIGSACKVYINVHMMAYS